MSVSTTAQIELGEALLKSFGSALKTSAQTARLFSTGYPPLNKIVSGKYNGGVPSGRIIEIFGPSQSGKTHIAVELMISAQRQGGVAIFLDYERRFVPEFAARRGLNLEAPHFLWLQPRTWEQGNSQAVTITEGIRATDAFEKGAPIVCIFDSVVASNPKSKVDGGGAEGERAKLLEFNMSDTTALARATSSTLPVMAHLCNELDLTMVYLNQTRTAPGVVYGDPTTVPGGKAMGFFADVRIQLGKKIDKDTQKNIVGQIITAKALKAPTAPFQETSWVLSFEDDGDTVFDREASLVEHMVEEGIIATPSKGYVEFEGQKFRKAALIAAVKQDPAGYDKLVAMLPV